jgi:hypothetical protein
MRHGSAVVRLKKSKFYDLPEENPIKEIIEDDSVYKTLRENGLLDATVVRNLVFVKKYCRIKFERGGNAKDIAAEIAGEMGYGDYVVYNIIKGSNFDVRPAREVFEKGYRVNKVYKVTTPSAP